MNRHPLRSAYRALPIDLPQSPRARRRREEAYSRDEEWEGDAEGEHDAGKEGGDDAGQAGEGGGEACCGTAVEGEWKEVRRR